MSDISELVSDLPEIYQRIWNHPEYDESSRLCEDRAAYIKKAVESLQTRLGKKNLRVLDLGCAQGYFCFTLRSIGCEVFGIDFCAQNIALCKALSEESGLDCSFTHEKLTKEFVENIKEGEYDVVLCLSVIHHVANENGFEYTRGIFEALASKANVVLAELAVKAEPLYWNKNLPNAYEDWFKNIAFFDELAFFPTHLSDVSRPLVLFSAKYFYCENQLFAFDEWKKSSYRFKSDDDSRRYYFDDSHLMKLCRSQNEYFRNEVRKEVDFLKQNEDLSFTPKVLASQTSLKSDLSVYRINKGALLMDEIKDGKSFDFDKIFSDLLENCVELEKRGYYHGDLRIWNVCVKDGDAFLIDFGDIKKEKNDSVAKAMNPNYDFTVYDAFMSIVYDVLTVKSYDTIRDYGLYSLTAGFDFSKVPSNYAAFFSSYLLIPQNELNFERLRELFYDFVVNKNSKSFSDSQKIEILSALQKRFLSEKADYLDARKLDVKYSRHEGRLSEHDGSLSEHDGSLSDHDVRLSDHDVRLSEHGGRLSQLEQMLARQDAKLSEQAGQIEDLRSRLDSTYNLLVNTRHRTLYGALAWLWHKVFKRR